ncbi:MAG: hypothetical protein ACYSTJ_01680 [Planctomycetota bacterium]|jgi:hypothetical protein
MKAKFNGILRTAFFLIAAASLAFGQTTEQKKSFAEYLTEGVPTKKDIDVFLNDISWAQFDPDVGYILSNYMPHDGMDGSSTISTVRPNGARTSFMYTNEPCRINTYGDSFTQCHQVSDGETWQEYLAAHLGEPIRNFGMGGFGVYQAYRRMLREEKTKYGAKYIILYIWGDDHIRSLLRCRYILTRQWNQQTNRAEGPGKMFHGNFWSHMEIDLETGNLLEMDSLLPTPQSLYKMTDPDWMYEALKDDLALQMYLYKNGEINDIPIEPLKTLSKHLKCPADLSAENLRSSVAQLLDRYSFEATKYILNKAREFASANNKKLMVIIFNPSVTRELLNKAETRYDREIVDFLNENNFNYIDMNLFHVEDFKSFNLSVDDYFNRYFIGHYSPVGNHFFAYSIKDRIIKWLDPKPITYQDPATRLINFKDYLPDY